MAPNSPRLIALSVLLSVGSLASQDLPQQSPRISSYDMTVELFPETKTVAGTQLVTWRNDTDAPTQELRFHLYLNAFRDQDSTLMRESDAGFRAQWQEGEYGGTVVSSVALVESDADPVVLQTGFDHPDDNNVLDETVFVVLLPNAVQPGESVTVEMAFESRMPKAYRRTGWIPGGGFMVFHWYPILGVLESDGQGGSRWNCHQFHSSTEFFADFSVYDVKLTVPSIYWSDETGVSGRRVGATGGQPSEIASTGDKVMLRFEQEDVHNFAFVADPSYVRYEEIFEPVRASDDPTGMAPAVARALGTDVADYDLSPVTIILLLHPEHDTQQQRSRHFEAIRVGLEFYGLRYGSYPYQTVTAVDPGRDIAGRGLGGGMEYPTLFTCGTTLFPHARTNRPEGVTVHEFGHQFWYGLSGNNEFEESWLDEGINSYSESRAQYLAYNLGQMDNGYQVDLARTTSFGVLQLAVDRGPWLADEGIFSRQRVPGLGRLPDNVQSTLADMRFTGTWMPESPLLDLMRSHPTATWYREVSYSSPWDDRARSLDTDNPDPMVKNGWEYIDRSSYSANSYTRPATVLNTLERMVGKTPWWSFMREFHAQSRFGHPTTLDFEALLEARFGPEVVGFFRTATSGGARFDYGVHSVGERSVVVRNYGNYTADVQVRVTFEGGGEPVYETIGAADSGPVYRLSYPEDRPPIAEVWIDPPPSEGEFEFDGGAAGVYFLDANLINNAWTRQRHYEPALYRALRLLLQVQSEFSFAGLIG